MKVNININRTVEFKEYSLTDRKELPAGRGVYMFLDDSNNVLYIGESKSLYTRVGVHLNGHTKLKPYLHQIKRLLIADLNLGNYGRKVIEGILVEKFDPPYNVDDEELELSSGKGSITKDKFFDIMDRLDRKEPMRSIADRHGVVVSTIHCVSKLKHISYQKWAQERKQLATV